MLQDSEQIAEENILAISMWRNDYVEFQIDPRVLIRPDINTNKHTRTMSLFTHLEHEVYTVVDILKFLKLDWCQKIMR